MDQILFLAIGLGVGALLGWALAVIRRPKQGAPAIETAALEERSAQLLDRAERAETLLREREERERIDKEQESKVLQALSPVQDRLREMKAKVEELDKERTEQFTTISEQLRSQREAEAALRNTTTVLANALTNNQSRGQWGELRLEQIVTQAGLTKGVHYETQFETTNDSGDKIKPDMVILLPEGKSIAVDSKVPYQAYLKAMEEQEKGIDANKKTVETLLKQHATDVRAKVTELGKKNYWSGLSSSPEFTLMFIPNEPVLAATLDNDSSLMEYAFSQRVAIVSPVSFFTVLKTIAYTWRKSADEQTIDKVIDLGVAIYRELRLLAQKTVKLRGHLEAVVEDFNDLAGTLDGKFLKATRNINDEAFGRLGDKEIPETKAIETPLKHLVQPELIAEDPKNLS